MHSFASVFMCFYCDFTAETCIFGTFHMFIPKYTWTIFKMKYTVLLGFSCVFTVFTQQKHVLLVHFTCIYQNTHVFYILQEMHSFASVLMCFNCVLQQKHVLLVHYIYLPKYTWTIYSTSNTQFCLYFNVFSLYFHCRNMYFWYISHVLTKLHMYHIFEMKCKVLLVFSCVFTVFSQQKHVTLVHVTCL
jgi:hypothetical protein